MPRADRFGALAEPADDVASTALDRLGDGPTWMYAAEDPLGRAANSVLCSARRDGGRRKSPAAPRLRTDQAAAAPRQAGLRPPEDQSSGGAVNTGWVSGSASAALRNRIVPGLRGCAQRGRDPPRCPAGEHPLPDGGRVEHVAKQPEIDLRAFGDYSHGVHVFDHELGQPRSHVVRSDPGHGGQGAAGPAAVLERGEHVRLAEANAGRDPDCLNGQPELGDEQRVACTCFDALLVPDGPD